MGWELTGQAGEGGITPSKSPCGFGAFDLIWICISAAALLGRLEKLSHEHKHTLETWRRTRLNKRTVAVKQKQYGTGEPFTATTAVTFSWILGDYFCQLPPLQLPLNRSPFMVYPSRSCHRIVVRFRCSSPVCEHELEWIRQKVNKLESWKLSLNTLKACGASCPNASGRLYASKPGSGNTGNLK